jgi:hypothetical protein
MTSVCVATNVAKEGRKKKLYKMKIHTVLIKIQSKWNANMATDNQRGNTKDSTHLVEDLKVRFVHF